MTKYPDRYVITGISKEEGHKVWLYFSDEGGGWWQWGAHEAWATRFESTDEDRFKDALLCARNGSGPWYNTASKNSVMVEAVPAIVRVY